MLSLQLELQASGYVHIENSSYIQFDEITQSLGSNIKTTFVEVKHSNNGGPLVTSSKALGLHTDYHKANYIAWFCHCDDPVGGLSLLCDTKNILRNLTEEEIVELKKIKLFEHNIENKNQKLVQPLLSSNNDGEYMVYYSFWLADEATKENLAFKKFSELANRNVQKIQIKTGDILIVNNHRMLHGRTKIHNEQRRLERRWLC